MRMYFLWQHSKFCVVIIPFSTLAPLSFDPPVSFIDDHASTDLSICPCLPRLGKSLELYIAQPFLKGWIRQTKTVKWLAVPLWSRLPDGYSHILRLYRDEINSLQIQLSRTQAGPGRAVKEQQEQNSPNHVQRMNLISVHLCCLKVAQK